MIENDKFTINTVFLLGIEAYKFGRYDEAVVFEKLVSLETSEKIGNFGFFTLSERESTKLIPGVKVKRLKTILDKFKKIGFLKHDVRLYDGKNLAYKGQMISYYQVDFKWLGVTANLSLILDSDNPHSEFKEKRSWFEEQGRKQSSAGYAKKDGLSAEYKARKNANIQKACSLIYELNTIAEERCDGHNDKTIENTKCGDEYKTRNAILLPKTDNVIEMVASAQSKFSNEQIKGAFIAYQDRMLDGHEDSRKDKWKYFFSPNGYYSVLQFYLNYYEDNYRSTWVKE